jgi:hypothetical protein
VTKPLYKFNLVEEEHKFQNVHEAIFQNGFIFIPKAIGRVAYVPSNEFEDPY